MWLFLCSEQARAVTPETWRSLWVCWERLGMGWAEGCDAGKAQLQKRTREPGINTEVLWNLFPAVNKHKLWPLRLQYVKLHVS